ncbi:MAG TPA: permease prefix domain 1-containing protein [Pseudonocardia sp.]|jgi:hypothetical protein
MSGPDDTAALDAYLAEVGRRLSDPDRGEVLDELRDHALSHAESLVAAGVADREAVAVAVRDLGPVDRLAGRLRAELLRPYLRRLSAALLLTGLACAATWTAVLLAGPAEPWDERTEPALVALLDVSGRWSAESALGLAATSVLTLLLTGRMRCSPRNRWTSQVLAITAASASLVLGIATGLQLLVYLAIRAHVSAASLAWPLVITTALLTLGAAPLVLHPLRGALRLSSGAAS